MNPSSRSEAAAVPTPDAPPDGRRAAPDLEEQFRATFEHAAVGIAHVAPDGRWLRVNPRLCEIVGYAQDELTGLTLQSITHAEDVDRARARARQLLEGRGGSSALEVRLIRRDGSLVWTALSGSVVRAPDGEPRYCIVVAADISQRKEAEELLAREHEALQLERRRLRTVLDLLPAGLWIADADGRIVETNDGARTVWGGDPPTSGEPARYHEEYRAFWPDGRPLSAGEWGLARAVEKGERSGPEEVLIEGFDGTRRTILNYGIPIRDEAGAIDGAVALSVDISDRKRIEADFRDANARLALLLRSAGGLLSSERPREFVRILFDDLAAHLGVDVYFNYLVEHRDGAPRLRLDSAGGVPDEVVDQYGWLEFGSAVCGRVAQDRRRMVLDRVQERRDTASEVIRSLGVTAYVCHPLLARDELVGTLSFGFRGRAAFEPAELDLLQAVSDHVAAAIQRSGAREAERRARVEAEEASRARTDFMATVSHELRTPLNAIIGYTQLLEEGVPSPIPREHLRSVRRIRYGARHLQQLIDEILAFSRLEAGRGEVEVEEIAVEDLLREVRAVIEPLASENGLSFRIEAEDGPASVRSDPRKVRQILLNLLGNATKFTEEGEVGLEVASGADGVVFTVTDTGIGIREEDREKLFQPFWQADSSTSRRVGGTGLGLSISRRYVELLGGSLSFESTPGEGTTFRLELPDGAGPPSEATP